jgi:hypothetical protein
MSIDPDDWKMAERIAENSNIYKTPQDVLNAFEAFMKQVETNEEEGESEKN